MRMFKRQRYCKECGEKLFFSVFEMYYCYDCNEFFRWKDTISRRFAKILKMTGRR